MEARVNLAVLVREELADENRHGPHRPEPRHERHTARRSRQERFVRLDEARTRGQSPYCETLVVSWSASLCLLGSLWSADS